MFSEQHEFDQTMVGETISKKNAWLALACAIGFHALLLAIDMSIDVPTSKRTAEIRITLLEEKVEEERDEEIEKQPKKRVKTPTPQRPTPVSPATSILVAKPPKTESTQSSISVVVNINSDEFKKFLRNETNTFRNTNPKSLGEFDQTFEVPRRESNEVSTVSKEAQIQIRRTGVGMSEDKDGNRTCYAQIPDLYNPNGPPTLLSKPCTPPKKFILDLDKPRNN